MASRHSSTKYRDSSANIKVLLRQQTNMTLNERFHKIMKMGPAQAPRPRTPPRDSRIREELRAHQRKLENLERSALQMMSRSLTSIAAPPSIPTTALPTAPVYHPPKQPMRQPMRQRAPQPQVPAKARLGRAPGGLQQRLGAKRLTQKYARQRTVPVKPAPKRLSSGTGNPRGRGGARGGRGGGSSRGGRGGGASGSGGTPNKDKLDAELDSYMSNSRAYLDNQLDSYMAQKGGEKDITKS